MLKLRMVCGFAVMVCALAAFASPALAFKEFTGKEGKVATSTTQVFTAAGVEVKCASVTGTAGKESKEQVKTMGINYEKCFIGEHAATVSGCIYNFHINGTVSLVGNLCTVSAGATCTLKIEEGLNKELKAVEYKSLGAEESELKANVTSISAVGSGELCKGIKTKTATYVGAITIKGIDVA